MGCYRMQGYYFSRPLPADEIAPFVAATKRTKGQLQLKTV